SLAGFEDEKTLKKRFSLVQEVESHDSILQLLAHERYSIVLQDAQASIAEIYKIAYISMCQWDPGILSLGDWPIGGNFSPRKSDLIGYCYEKMPPWNLTVNNDDGYWLWRCQGKAHTEIY
ncbi:hypothetical protein ACJX0J_010512, partial [Zea mays]